jgi:hypothetical protein
MLDRLKLAVCLDQLSGQLFPDVARTLNSAVEIYRRIASDSTFAQRAREAESSFMVPAWAGNLLDTFLYEKASQYTVLAVDGSQVYPNRHMAGVGCFLINIGGAYLRYGAVESSVSFFSTPEVVPFAGLSGIGDTVSTEFVDLLRESRELSEVVRCATDLQDQSPVVLIDGTIIFWMLEGKSPDVRAKFLQEYMAAFEQLYLKRIVYAGYISMPKSREVMSLVKLGLCRFTVANCIPCHAVYDTFPCKVVDALLDTHLMSKLLEPGQRSPLFETASSITREYPPYARPWFCYLHVGGEIVRLEMPAWVAADEQLVTRVCAVALDQATKGSGYPVVLAEAHEQAVVKSADREFFYQLITKVGMHHNRLVHASLKSMTKRSMKV